MQEVRVWRMTNNQKVVHYKDIGGSVIRKKQKFRILGAIK